MVKAFGVFTPGKPIEHRLPELRGQGVAVFLAGPPVSQHLPGHPGQAKRVVEFPKVEQPGVGGDLGTVEFQLEALVESDPLIRELRFTQRHVHLFASSAIFINLIYMQNS